MNNLFVRDVKYQDEQYRIGEGIISDDAFKQLEKLFIPVDPEPIVLRSIFLRYFPIKKPVGKDPKR